MQFSIFTATLVTFIVDLSDGVSVIQGETSLTQSEKENVTLTCTYTDDVDYLFWYRQLPGRKPEFAVLTYKSSSAEYKAEFAKKRFSSTVQQSDKSYRLTISELQLSDTAVYYCAARLDPLEPLVFGAGAKLTVHPERDSSEPSVYILPPYDSDTKNAACLATDYFPQNVSMVVAAGNKKQKQDKSKGLLSTNDRSYSLTGFLDKLEDPNDFTCHAGNTVKHFPTADQLKYSCINVEEAKGDPQYNLLSLTVFGLRILFVKSIVFNMLMTIRIWVS